MNNLSMLKAIQQFQEVANKLDPGAFAVAVLASLVASWVASAMYRYFYESRGTGSQVNRAFPLLGISITTLFIGVQVSLPLSLGLLGALSIIRFRTPIKEPEEVGFIMLVIAGAISCATFNFQFLVILYAIALAALLLARGTRAVRQARRDGVLLVTLPDAAAAEQAERVVDFLRRNARSCMLESSTSRDGVTSLQMTFAGLKQGVGELQDGLRKAAPVTAINVFLDRPGGIR